MLVLFETAAGYALFKVLKENKLQETENLYKEFESPEKASKIVKLVTFKKFKDTTDALAAATALIEGKVGKSLKKLLKKCVMTEVQEPLAVADSKFGALLKEKFNISCVSNNTVLELMRGIRGQMDSLIGELPHKERAAMELGLAHSLSRYKVKFSPEKVDTMIIQAVSLLDDLDKELNNYVMRCREWYGWHFPELGKIVQDPIAFAKVVMKVGLRINVATTDFSDILPEDLEEKLKLSAEISMGTEISDIDIANIRNLCDQILEISNYRTQLYDYLKNRMMSLAPNLTILLGELVGARLIAHAGSLMNLAKYPASTVQILGAEKALFRALKTKRDTPKYGLIYHAQLIGHTPTALKGKMSRMLAAKSALACRLDALGEESSSQMGLDHRAYLEQKIKSLQERGTKRVSGTGKQGFKFESYKVKGEATPYDVGADSTMPKGQKRKFEETTEPPLTRKRFKEEIQQEESENQEQQQHEDGEGESKAKKKKEKKRSAPPADDEGETVEEQEQPVEFKKKKRRETDETTVLAEEQSTVETAEGLTKKKKRKKQKQQSEADD